MMRFGYGGKKEEQIAQLAGKLRAGLGTRSVVLVGMPGCGKSAIGRRLASRLELPFVDADDEIELAAGKAITDIFKEHGEPYFREGERKVIARILNSGSQVLATGGGAFMSAETRENIRNAAVSVWLKAELTLLLRRVLKRNNRPLLERDPEGVMRSLVETRYPIYATADITVESRDLPHDVMVFEIIEALAAHTLAPQPEPSVDAASRSSGEPI
ncbi:MAG TPA: shikimate kinase [Hyphomicrobiaceae bacterium]|jgi:shikimate kinase|nr:shikimate kinase [Hyphomicrobiaceae bacterium]